MRGRTAGGAPSPAGVGTLSHESVTALHLSAALRGPKQKRKRMRLAGRQVPQPHSPAPQGLGSARPGRPAGPCKAAAMARRRARGCRTLGLPALLLLLLLQLPATLGITCPDPVSVEHADIQVKSYSLHSRERYICNSGFKRKAGTSSLTECVLNKATNVAYWTTPSLKCIRDPALARQRPAPPSTVTTAGVTLQPKSFSPSGKGSPGALAVRVGWRGDKGSRSVRTSHDLLGWEITGTQQQQCVQRATALSPAFPKCHRCHNGRHVFHREGTALRHTLAVKGQPPSREGKEDREDAERKAASGPESGAYQDALLQHSLESSGRSPGFPCFTCSSSELLSQRSSTCSQWSLQHWACLL
ncbi:interleukin-15 receptor subunit alpha isoform X1 [Saimiri boliviensis]|uniref:interleukin-15 receptor subunit alpha isoform X1 n=1 Tax=Saimiri boliviensis TaxID=27679 RepID=UPI00193E771E|nr:interleukin-15 receptor subunit alpha isoform X1 [Saimiri boliviensis boliviensis]